MIQLSSILLIVLLYNTNLGESRSCDGLHIARPFIMSIFSKFCYPYAVILKCLRCSWMMFSLCSQLLPGNTNTYTVVEQTLEPPMLATKIRFVPYSLHVRTVCMRVELVGCPWTGKCVALNSQ